MKDLNPLNGPIGLVDVACDYALQGYACQGYELNRSILYDVLVNDFAPRMLLAVWFLGTRNP